MEKPTPAQIEIQKITSTFGMKMEVASKAMGITTGTFRNKKSLRCKTDFFNQKNLEDLKTFINNLKI